MEIRVTSKGFRKLSEHDRLVIDHEVLSGADLSGRKLVQFVSIGSRFTGCRLERMRIQDGAFGAGREPSEYVNCSFDRSRIEFGPSGYARFVGCSFRDVKLSDWLCFTVEIVDCTFTGHLRKAFFNGTVPDDDRPAARRERNEFRGNDFSAAELVDVGFRTGIDLTQQRLPSGPAYLYVPDAPAAVQRARLAVIGWDDLEARQKAMGMIKGLETDVQGGQRQLLLRRDTYSVRGTTVVDRVFDLLAS